MFVRGRKTHVLSVFMFDMRKKNVLSVFIFDVRKKNTCVVSSHV